MAGKGSQSPPSLSKHGNAVARIQRNVAEKQRRDKLNGYISELANIVPMVSMSSKRLDKTSILRLSAAHLRICKSSLGGKQKKSFKWCPNFLTNEQIREILESVDGFLIITTSNGKILFTSRSVERFLGHQDIDLIGHSLFTFVHPDDLDAVKDEMEKILLACIEKGTSCRCSFECRLKEKGQPRSEVVTYQSVHFVGGMTPSDGGTEEDEKGSKSVVGHMFKAFVKIVDISPYNQLSLEEAMADEYVTRHSLDGTIIFADHRLATITGHMPHEVVGLSAYAYIHSDDTPVALFAHHLMFSSDKGTGMIVYRLRTRDDRFVYLKTVGCLQFDAVTSKVDHFVCVNQQLSDSDGDLQLKYFVERYIPHIKGSSTTSLLESVKALQTSTSSKISTVTNKTNDHVANVPSQHRDPKIEVEHILKKNGKKESIAVKQEDVKNGFTGFKEQQTLTNTKGSEIQMPCSSSEMEVADMINQVDAKYFSKTFHTSTSKSMDVIYVSSLDSTLSINKTSGVFTSVPSSEGIDVNGRKDPKDGSSKNASLKDVQLPSKIFEIANREPEISSDGYFQKKGISHIQLTTEHSQDSDASHSSIVDKNFGHHSLLNNCNGLTLMSAANSVAILTNSTWPVDECDLKGGISSSSLDCYDIPMETNTEVKSDLKSQEELDSLLRLRNGETLLPPPDSWNDVYSITDPLSSESLLQSDEQFPDNNPNAKPFGLW